MYDRWKFPYKRIEKNEKIVLYGAGKVGHSYKKLIDDTGYCKMIAWVDTNYKQLNEEEILSPEIIRNIEYDKVLIAIKNEINIAVVTSQLKGMGVANEKIVTINDCVIKDNSNIKITEKDFNVCPDLKHLDIAFVVPDPIKGGGGHRNIFRAVRYLRDFGHAVTIYIYKPTMDAIHTKINVSEWFYSMEGVTFICNDELNYHDVGIATSWETPYLLKKYEKQFRNLFYFVQDFEPYFFAMSSGYFLAENTYKLGFSHICSGPWIDRVLREKYDAESIYFQFPLDRTKYHSNYVRKKKNKNILFFAKPEMPRRCFELGVQALAIFKKKCPEIEIIMFGSTELTQDMVPFETTIANYVPSLEGLAEMYANADLGIVFSPTNPSLVPYEMMSCGCPVVDLDVEMAITKYGDDERNVFLLDPMPERFANALYDIINNDELLKIHKEYGRNWSQKEFPSELEMAKIVENCIVQKVRDGIMC